MVVLRGGARKRRLGRRLSSSAAAVAAGSPSRVEAAVGARGRGGTPVRGLLPPARTPVARGEARRRVAAGWEARVVAAGVEAQIGRASCRERVYVLV